MTLRLGLLGSKNRLGRDWILLFVEATECVRNVSGRKDVQRRDMGLQMMSFAVTPNLVEVDVRVERV